MTAGGDGDIYRIEGPTAWPPPPATLSFSSLTSIERCPRQWQLSRARYGDHVGFPSRPGPAVEGQIIHAALEILFRACGFAGMPTMGTPPFMELMTALGLGKTIQRLMREREEAVASHPRGGGFRFRRSANQLANEVMRLFRQQYRPRDAGRLVEPHMGRSSAPPDSPLDALRALKAIPELKLKHPSLPFLGVIDLVRETSAGVTIVDFKTGLPSDSHLQQVLVYAVLWWRVTGHAPTTVEIVYPMDTVTKTVDVTQLQEAESALRSRVVMGLALLASHPASATTGPHCAICDVRQFCGDYWKASSSAGDWVDFEATVTGQKGPASVAVRLSTGGNAELVFQPDTPASRLLASGATIRALGALRREAGVFELTRTSEVFVRQ